MRILWKYLKPQRGLILLSLLLAGISQLLNLVDPLIFGKIIDDYATNPGNRSQQELTNGVLKWLGIAIAVALLARVGKSFQEYFTRLAVQKFGMQIFNDGLKQTLRLSFQDLPCSRYHLCCESRPVWAAGAGFAGANAPGWSLSPAGSAAGG